jgi:hypothetical protein
MSKLFDTLTAVGFVAALLLSTVAQAESGVAGTIKSVRGDVRIERGSNVLAATVGAPIRELDRIVTGKDSSTGVTFKDDTLISTGANSTLVINQFAFNSITREGGFEASLLSGAMRFVSGFLAKFSPKRVAINTPTTTIGIRGTDFIVEVSDGD